MPPLSPRALIRSCPDLREPERRRLLALDDATLHKLHVEWNLPGATTARVASALAEHHVSFDNVKHYRVVLEGRRVPTQSAELTASRKPPPSGEERRRGHVDARKGVSDADVVLHEPDPSSPDELGRGPLPPEEMAIVSRRFHGHVNFRYGAAVRDAPRRATSKR